MAIKLKELGKLISKTRKKRFMTPHELADRCDCTEDWIRKIESGYVPSLAMLRNIFASLGIDSQYDQWKAIIKNNRWDDD